MPNDDTSSSSTTQETDSEAIQIGQLAHDSDIDYSTYRLTGPGLSSLARLSPDGRISIDLSLAHALPGLPDGYANDVKEDGIEKPKSRTKGKSGVGISLNVVILIVGSRGDVQPYIALALQLVADGHRVRLATHGDFKDFVRDGGKGKVEFFDIGGSPKDLMAYMVKNPGLIPGLESMTNGDIGKKRKMLSNILDGCYRATHAPDAETKRTFAADAIISNPPAFAHIHVAEALGIPLQMSFTMPWTASTAFSHPLVNIKSSNANQSLTNYLSFALADLLTWQGLADVINSFRTSTLGLAPLSLRSGPSVLDRLKVPWTYCWSSGLIEKPADWKNNIDVAGFYFLDQAKDYTPEADLAAFLDAGDPPIYIGFGSVPVSDPKAMTSTIFEAVKASGVRALVSAGWGGLGGKDVPDNVFILGNVPHDWLFTKVSAVCHHGGAGTCSVGLLNGKATIVVPFFGDQQFWGEMVCRAQAGAMIHSSALNAENLADAIRLVMAQPAQDAAASLGEQIRSENGTQAGVDSFYSHLPLRRMRCDVDPSLPAVWWSQDLCLKLSGLAVQTLVDAKKVKLNTLETHRTKEYDTKKQATDPITGGAAAILSTVTNYYMGIGQIFINPPKGIINTTTAIPRGVHNILVSLHEGFQNLPKAYGSEVRPAGKVSGFKDGVREGAKGLFWGYADGSLVKEPLEGGKKEGLMGVIKGAGRSYVNVTLKPAAGIVGVVAHPADGAWKSCQSLWSQKSVSSIRETRISDGLAAFKATSPARRKEILAKFEELKKGTDTRRKEMEDEARKILSGKGGEGGEGEEVEDGDALTLVDESEAEQEEGDRGKTNEAGGGLSDTEIKLLRQLALAEEKGYERGRKEAGAGRSSEAK